MGPAERAAVQEALRETVREMLPEICREIGAEFVRRQAPVALPRSVLKAITDAAETGAGRVWLQFQARKAAVKAVPLRVRLLRAAGVALLLFALGGAFGGGLVWWLTMQTGT